MVLLLEQCLILQHKNPNGSKSESGPLEMLGSQGYNGTTAGTVPYPAIQNPNSSKSELGRWFVHIRDSQIANFNHCSEDIIKGGFTNDGDTLADCI